MRLPGDVADARLAAVDHGVLATVDAERGVHAVPAVFALDDGHLGVPIDRVKPKSAVRLRRLRNLDADPRASLLVDWWDRDDWTRLWWVRADLTRVDDAPTAKRLESSLAERYAQYRTGAIAEVVVFRIDAVTGWAAAGEPTRSR